jgi:hypothetical protein
MTLWVARGSQGRQLQADRCLRPLLMPPSVGIGRAMSGISLPWCSIISTALHVVSGQLILNVTSSHLERQSRQTGPPWEWVPSLESPGCGIILRPFLKRVKMIDDCL